MPVFLILAALSCTLLEGRESTYIIFFYSALYVDVISSGGELEKMTVLPLEETEILCGRLLIPCVVPEDGQGVGQDYHSTGGFKHC